MAVDDVEGYAYLRTREDYDDTEALPSLLALAAGALELQHALSGFVALVALASLLEWWRRIVP
jgi:hypothetical protein